MGGKNTTSTTTNTPNPTFASGYQNVLGRAQQVASVPYKPYSGQLVAGLNSGQNAAVGQIQNASTAASPYLKTGAQDLSAAYKGLGAVQPYLQAASEATAGAQPYMNQESAGLGTAAGYLGNAQGYYGQAAGYATPQAFDASQLSQYEDPYTQSVIGSTLANMDTQNAIQQQQVVGNAVQSGAWGGDRAAVAQSELARNQALAGNQTIAGLESQNYAQALGQYNQQQANRFQGAGLLGNLGNSEVSAAGAQGAIAGQYGTLAGQKLAQGAQYGNLGQLQGQTAQSYGSLGGLAGYLGQAAEQTGVAGGAAALQAATLGQQTQQQKDTAAYGQYMQGLGYPYQQTGWLSNVVQGIGSQSGGTGTTTGQGPSVLSQVAGVGTTGLGILGATGAFGSNGYLTGAQSVNSLGDFNNAGAANGGRIGSYARGGSVRRGFDAGGVPGLGAVGGLVTDPNQGLLAGAAPIFGGGSQVAAPSRAGVPVSRMPGLGAVGGATQSATPASGLGVLSGSGPATAPAAAPGVLPTDGSNNVWLGITAAGLGMLGGSSPFAGVNIGQGGLAGLKEYQELNAQDRQNAVANSDVAYKSGSLALDTRKEDYQEALNKRLYDAAQQAAGYLQGSPPAAGAASAVSPPVGPVAAPAAGTVAPTATPASPPTATPSAAGSVADPSAASAPTVNPNWDPTQLSAQADKFQKAGAAMMATNPTLANGMLERAQQMRTLANKVVTDNRVLNADGTVGPLPGALATTAAEAKAKAEGEQAGKVQTVYTLDGDQIPVTGDVYQKLAKNGGGEVNGQPVLAGESPYVKPIVANYTEFSKKALEFEADYQNNAASLDELAHIYSNYQSGRGAEVAAELDGYARQIGLSLPKGWASSQAGYDAALKSAVDQAFKNMAASGATKAPATGLRESLLTSARPDAAPAAVFKVITDKKAALQYSHDMYDSFINGDVKDPTKAVVSFQNTHKYADYLDAARSGTPLPAGATPQDLNTVVGPMPGHTTPGGVSAPYTPGGASFASTPPPAQSAAPALPSVGDIRKGYRYTGGDPSQRSSWAPVQ